MSVRHKQEIAKRHSRGIFYKHSPETIERMRVVQNRSDVRARRSASMRKTLSSPAMRDKWAAAKLGKAKNMSARGLLNISNGHKTESARSNYRAAQRKRALQKAKYVMFNGVPTILSDVGRALGISNSHARYYYNRGRWPVVTTPTEAQ